MSFGANCQENEDWNEKKNYYKKLFVQAPDILFVASAGNEDINAVFQFPSATPVPNIICVGATDQNDQRSIWTFLGIPFKASNYGESVHLFAPGTAIFTTRSITETTATIFTHYFLGDYKCASGTSLSAPFVTGVAAILFRMDDTLTPTEVKSILIETADIVDTDKGPVRRLNALNAVNAVLKRLGVNNEHPVNTLPVVSILCPSNNDTFTAGGEVSFSGNGTDVEDGTISGNSLVWTSDKDGQIDTGESLSITTLSVNTHIITLTVADSKGGVSAASVNITIKAQPPQSNDDWPMEGHDPARTNTTSATLQVPLVKVWEFVPISESEDQEIYFSFSPVVKDGVLYISSYYYPNTKIHTKIHALNVNTGAQIYERVCSKHIKSLTISGGFLYAVYYPIDYSYSRQDYGVGAYKTGDGSLAWEWLTPNRNLIESILAAQGKIFVNILSNGSFKIYILDAENGYEIGSPLERPEKGGRGLSFSDGFFYTVSRSLWSSSIVSISGGVYAFNAETQEQIWKNICIDNAGFVLTDYAPVISSGICLVGNIECSYSSKRIYGLDLKTGEIKWDFLYGESNKDSIGCPFAVTSNVVYFMKYSYIPYTGNRYRGIYALNIQNGEKLWESNNYGFMTENLVTINSLIVSSNLVFVLMDDRKSDTEPSNGKIVALRKNNGQKIWEYDLINGNIGYAPIIAGGKLIFVEDSNKLVAFGPQ